VSGTPTAPPGFRGIFRTDDDARAVYSEAAGVTRIIPSAVAVPADADDVVTLARWAAGLRVSLTPRGAGSSMANGAVGSGVLVDLSRLGGMGPVDAAKRRITVGAAVTRDAVDLVAREAGLTLPVDPSSGAFATIGGMCATNAAGARSVRHGATREWVHGLDCVFANGDRAWLRRGEPVPPIQALNTFHSHTAPILAAVAPELLRHVGVRKESSGYGLAAWRNSGDLVDLIVGSEGTLALIVGVELRLAPLPGGSAGLLAGFPDLEGAAAAAVRVAKAGASAVELLDRTFLEVAGSGSDPLPVSIPRGFEAVLVIEVEGATDAEAIAKLGDIAGWCDAGGALHIEQARDRDEKQRLWQLRHTASPILNRLSPRLQSMQLIEDGCVPPERFAEYLRGVRHALAEARFRGVIFGHAGDGHAHVNALVDVAESDWRARAEYLLESVTALVVRLGGTLAGEHGDGRLRAPFLHRLWSATALESFAAVKRAFDPDGKLNPGVILPAFGASPLGDVKHDPALPPLPSSARDALDHVVREKAWGAFRLDLLSPPMQPVE